MLLVSCRPLLQRLADVVRVCHPQVESVLLQLLVLPRVDLGVTMYHERSHKEHLELLSLEASADESIALQSQNAKRRFEASPKKATA